MLEDLYASSAASAQEQDLEKKRISEMREATLKQAEENEKQRKVLHSQLVTFNAQAEQEKGSLDTEHTRLQQWALELEAKEAAMPPLQTVPMQLQPPGQPEPPHSATTSAHRPAKL